MPAPTITVQIAFDLSAAGQGDFLTLDDPVKGELDNATYPLAGDTLQDVTEYVRDIRIRRGRSNALERFQAGACDVTLDNRTRLFDPTAGTAISPYGVSLKPRKQIVVSMNGAPEFSGQVEDWDLSYTVAGDSTTSAKAADGFALLGQQTISPHVATAQTTGERISAVLDRAEIGWPGARRDIDTGLADLVGESIGGTASPAPVNALTYLQNVERDEPGALFIAKNGFLTFRQRTDLQQVTAVSFADDGTGVPFTSVGVEFGTEQLRNSVEIARLNAGTAVASDAQSQTDYGVISYEQRDSLLDSDTQAQQLANWLVNLYGQPQLRINEVGFALESLTNDQVQQLLSLELGDAVQVIYTPNGVGDPINRFVAIDSIEHNVTPGQHRMVFGLSQTIGAFILDSSVFGVLDDDILGF
jgi:hypothetical protein